jgi:hypothetical protein
VGSEFPALIRRHVLQGIVADGVREVGWWPVDTWVGVRYLASSITVLIDTAKGLLDGVEDVVRLS